MIRSQMADGQQIALLSLEELASDQGLEVVDAAFIALTHYGEMLLRIRLAGYEHPCICSFPEHDIRDANTESIQMRLRGRVLSFAAGIAAAGTPPPASLLEKIDAMR